MASTLQDFLLGKNRIKHGVGNLNSLKKRTIANGAKATEAIENFTLVELAFNAKGERVCSALKADANQAYLVAGVERVIVNGDLSEVMSDFYIGEGEGARIVILDKGLRFETSLFEGTPVNGKFAKYDVAKKKYVVADVAPTEGVVLQIVDAEAGQIDGQKLIRLEVQ